MKLRAIPRTFATLLVIFSLFSLPLLAMTPAVNASASALAKKGEKNFKQGLKYEVAEQWDKAAEEFALAVAANPGNAEYRLHYRRALFNASQMMMQRGRVFAEQKNYDAAYNAYRQAYGYDPTNELAKAEMNRMLRLQNEGENPKDPNKPDALPSGQPAGVKLVPTSYNLPQDPPQVEQLRDVKYTKVDLKQVIKDLARELELNVLFDSETFASGRGGGLSRELTIELQNVTTAQALDYIFTQEGLFFQKIGKRTIIVANQQRRQNFQQLVLRTFYLQNADPEKVKTVLQTAIPAQQGRPPSQAMVDKDTNSITIRDTSENIKIISNLIKALDKDRAEVVMDVNIYEVSKGDLLQIGNQIGSTNTNSPSSLGGINSGAVGVGENGQIFGRGNAGGTAGSLLNRAIAAGLQIPATNLIALQSKGTTRLLASTQVHAFNNEESQARIGRRVPVRTAQLLGYANQPGQPNNNLNNGNAAEVINYEQVGLTLKFKPIVFPNQDVQVQMSIESKDVGSGSDALTPTFSERTISGTARIQNNRTLLLASVVQDTQSNGRTGIPFLSFLPVIGRLFTAPRRTSDQVDIVIAVTPRVLRAPTILPEDEVEQPTGSIAVPTNSSLSDMLQREDLEDRLAAARRLPNVAVVQLQDQKPEETAAPAYVPASGQTPVNTATVSAPTTLAPDAQPKPIDSSVKTLNIAPTAEKLNGQPSESSTDFNAELNVEQLGALKAGEKRRVSVMVRSRLALRLVVLSLGFDSSKIKINRVFYGEVFGAEMAQKEMTSFAASNGNLMATFPTAPNSNAQGVGVLAYIEIEALADTDNANFQINNAVSSLIGYGGETLILKQ